jgi:Protein kinase domain
MDERLAKLRCSQWEEIDAALLAIVVGLAERTVVKRMRSARGNTLIQTAFAKEWPVDGDALGGLTVATARRAGLDLELASATGLGERAVRNRLARAPGQTLLMNAFEELLLDSDEEDDETDEFDDADDDDESLASTHLDPRQHFAPVDLVGGIRLTSLKRASELVDWLAERLGRNSLSVRATLRARRGHGDVRAAFEESWPIQIGQPPRGALGAMTVAAAVRSPAVVRWIADIIDLPAPETWACLEGVHGRSRVDSVLPQIVAGSRQPASQQTPRATSKQSRVGIVLDGRYELRSKLGEGSFGVVYDAIDLRHPNQRLVVKVSRVDQSTLVEELRSAFGLFHPNICAYMRDGIDAEYGTYLVLQHGGESLGNLMSREVLSVEQALKIVAQAAAGLDHAHGENVIHQDVKPDNILVDRQPTRWLVRVADFGMARRGTRGQNSMGHETVVASLVGYTPSYAAPEQLIDGSVFRASDQFALAKVFCSILEGRVFKTRYQFVGFGQLSPAQNAAVAKALNHDPRSRFASCLEFVEALRAG